MWHSDWFKSYCLFVVRAISSGGQPFFERTPHTLDETSIWGIINIVDVVNRAVAIISAPVSFRLLESHDTHRKASSISSYVNANALCMQIDIAYIRLFSF